MGSLPLIGTISGSGAAAVVGLNPYQSQVEKWQAIMEELHPGFNAARGYDFTPFTGNASTRWGTAFEDAVIGLAEDRAGMSICFREMVATHEWEKQFITERAWILNKAVASCHIDGEYLSDESKSDTRTLHEGKTTSEMVFRKKWGSPEDGRLPPEYAIQVQHQMMCTGADSCILSVLVFPKAPDEWEKIGWEVMPDNGAGYRLFKVGSSVDDFDTPYDWARVNARQGYFHQYHIQAHPVAQAALKAAYSDFWSRYVIPQIEPPCRTYEDVKRLFVDPKGTIIVDDEIESLCTEYKLINSQIGASGRLAKRKAKIRRMVLDYMRRADPMVGDDNREKTVMVSRTGKPLMSYNGKALR